MRVIAGTARRLSLMTPKGMETRPTLDREKETLFNTLQNDVGGSRFLDPYAGSGQIGIEALSRGAKEAVFVEMGRDASACIKKNLEHTKLSDKAVVYANDCLTAIAKLASKKESFDIIYMDPPYDGELYEDTLRAIKNSGILAEDGIVVVESRAKYDLSFVENMGFDMVKVKEYKTNKHSLLKLFDKE